MTMDHAHSFLL